MSFNIDFATLNIIIDNDPSTYNFFANNYSKSFTVSKSGYYIIHDNWCGVFKRVYNGVQSLEVKVDGVRQALYTYASVNSDQEWGTTRRTITGQDFLVYLTAGEHTLSTSGNLYFDDTYSPKHHYIYAEFFMEGEPNNS